MKAVKVFLYVAIVFLLLFILLGRITPEVDLGNNYTFNDECFHITCMSGDGDDVPSKVKWYAYNDDWIIAKQKPDFYFDSIYDYPKGFDESDYSLGLDTSYYWIIDKKIKKAYGPLLEDRYKKLKDSLKIKLQLKYYK